MTSNVEMGMCRLIRTLSAGKTLRSRSGSLTSSPYSDGQKTANIFSSVHIGCVHSFIPGRTNSDDFKDQRGQYLGSGGLWGNGEYMYPEDSQIFKNLCKA